MRNGKSKTDRDESNRMWRWACWDRTYVRIGFGGPCSKTDAQAAAQAFRVKNSAAKICVVGIENQPNTHEGFVRLDTGKWTPMGRPAARLPLLGLTLIQNLGEHIANTLEGYEIGLSAQKLRVKKGFSEHKVTIKINGGASGGSGKGGGTAGSGSRQYLLTVFGATGHDVMGKVQCSSYAQAESIGKGAVKNGASSYAITYER